MIQTTTNILGENMSSLMTLVNGFLFGSGLILAAVAFKVAFHVSMCG